MQEAITKQALRRYTSGTAPAAEAAAVRVWLQQPANQLLAEAWMRDHWETLEADTTRLPEEPDYEAMLSSLHQQLGLDTHQSRAAPRWRYWAAAASLAAAVAGGGYLWQQRPAAPAPLAYATPYGKTRTVHLPDGSTVILNGHSSLRYVASPAASQPREVWLEGEAYFSVKHQPNNQRFMVHTTAGFQVEVLGTKFTVSRRAEAARVVLLSGKVRVDFADARRPDLLMKPGELVETRDAYPTAVVHKAVKPEPYAAWKDAKLVLDETTIADLATRLHETYGLEVVVASADLNARKVTGTVPVRDLDILLRALSETFQLKVTREQNRIILSDSISH